MHRMTFPLLCSFYLHQDTSYNSDEALVHIFKHCWWIKQKILEFIYSLLIAKCVSLCHCEVSLLLEQEHSLSTPQEHSWAKVPAPQKVLGYLWESTFPMIQELSWLSFVYCFWLIKHRLRGLQLVYSIDWHSNYAPVASSIIIRMRGKHFM